MLKLGEGHNRRFALVYQDTEFQTFGGGVLYYTVNEFDAVACQRDDPPGVTSGSVYSQEQ